MNLPKPNFVSLKKLTEIATENYPLIERELIEVGVIKKSIPTIVKGSLEEAYLRTPTENKALNTLIEECKKQFICKSLKEKFFQNNTVNRQFFSYISIDEKKQSMLFCKVIRTLRIQNSFTQEQFYHSTGINIKRYENNQCVPKFNTLCKLLQHLNTDIGEFANLLEKEASNIGLQAVEH